MTTALLPVAKDIQFTDRAARAQETQQSLAFYSDLAVFDEIVVVDGTGYDWDSDRLSVKSSGHCLTSYYSFLQCQESTLKFGKSWGETEIYEVALTISSVAHAKELWKISGRWIVDNFASIMKDARGANVIAFTFHPNVLKLRPYLHTSLLKISPDLLASFSVLAKDMIQNNPGITLEECFYRFLVPLGVQTKTTHYPLYVVTSGSSGRRLGKSVIWQLKNILALGFGLYAYTLRK